MSESWWELEKRKAFQPLEKGEKRFIEITGLPKKIDSRSVTSLIVTASKVVPMSTNICQRVESSGYSERVALVQFKSVAEAHKAASLLKASVYSRRWELKLVAEPDEQ